MTKFIIKQSTIYLKGIKVNDHLVHTEVLEVGKQPYIIEQKPQEIMNQSCRFYGEHYHERKLFTNRLIGSTSKPPILVSPFTSTYFFCTQSERTPDNTWINILYVQHLKKLKGNKTKILLEQDKTLTFPISYHIVRQQYLKCTDLFFSNHRKNLFIKKLNGPNIDHSQEGYNIMDVMKMYPND